MLVVWVRRRRWLVLIVAALVVAVGLGVALSLYQLAQTEPLIRQADALPVGETRVARQREIVQFQADNLAKIWTTIVQALGAVALGVTGYVGWKNFSVTQDRLEVDRQAQITNRFTQAISQLGAIEDNKPNLEVRLGGIYALERIARDSPRDHWTIMEILTAYVRENAPWPPSPAARPIISPWRARHGQERPDGSTEVKPRADIQAILTVLGRRRVSDAPLEESPDPLTGKPEPRRLDLRRTDLRGAFLMGVNLRRADLRDARLDRADLSYAHLELAWLRYTRLPMAVLRGTHLEGADLWYARLDPANLWDSHLKWAKLYGAHLETAAVTQEQVYSALNHGEGAVLPPNWPPDWRDHMILVRNLKQYREKKGWTVDDLARCSYVAGVVIELLEEPAGGRATNETVTKLAEALGIEENVLITAVAPPAEPPQQSVS